MRIKVIFLCLFSIILLGSCKAKKTATKKKQRTERVTIDRRVGPNKNIKEVINKPPAQTITTAVTKKIEPPKNASYAEVVGAYVETYSKIAKEEMLQYGIPASITLAQGILESGAGRGELSNRANNHFGIKCHSQWKGDRVYHDDDEA